MLRQDFVNILSPYAVTLRAEDSPIFPSVRIAQNILETGCNIHSWFNLGGIKVGSGKPNGYWKGAVVNKGTWEVYDGKTVEINAAFRAYDNIYDFYKDQDILFGYSRYDRVRAARTPQEQAEMLYRCGYATDPFYATKILSIINFSNLEQYDVEADKMIQDLVNKIGALESKTNSLEGKIKDLETTAEVLESVKTPKWFIDEFGVASLNGIVSDQTGDLNFWRNVAVTLRLVHKK